MTPALIDQPRPAPCTLREGILVTVGLLALIALQLVVGGAGNLFSRHLWVDELYSYAVVADPSLWHALQAIHGGIDSMPTYQLILRALSVVTGPTEIFFRTVSLLSIVLALGGVYVLLRRSVAPLVALTAVLVVWAHPLSLTHAFDARFHGPFLAASVWFCFWVDRRQSIPDRRGAALGLALAALLLCSIHVFGIVVWAIVLTTAALVFRSWRRLWPALIGPVAVPMLWILALGPQRATITIPTWEAPFSRARAVEMAEFVLLPEYLPIVFLMMWGVLSLRRVFTEQPPRAGADPPAPSLILLTSLSVLVPVLVIMSKVIQPTLTPRYAIPAIAALAPAVAYGLARLPRWGAVPILLVLLYTSGNSLEGNAKDARRQDQRTAAVSQAVREIPDNQPVVFEVTHELAVVWHYAPDIRSRLVLLDFEHGQVPNPTRLRIVSRDLARAYARFYPAPQLVSWNTLQSSPEFYLAPDGRAHMEPPTAESRYPGFSIARVNAFVAKATRR